MNSIYDRNLASKTTVQLIELCRKCRPDELDGQEFAEHKRRVVEDYKRELANRNPKEVIDCLVGLLLVSDGPV